MFCHNVLPLPAVCCRALEEGFSGELPVPGGGTRTISEPVNNVASGSGYPTKKEIMRACESNASSGSS